MTDPDTIALINELYHSVKLRELVIYRSAVFAFYVRARLDQQPKFGKDYLGSMEWRRPHV